MTLLKCQAGVTSWCCSRSSMASPGHISGLYPGYPLRGQAGRTIFHHLKYQGGVVKRKAFGDAGFGQAVFADFLDVHFKLLSFR